MWKDKLYGCRFVVDSVVGIVREYQCSGVSRGDYSPRL